MKVDHIAAMNHYWLVWVTSWITLNHQHIMKTIWLLLRSIRWSISLLSNQLSLLLTSLITSNHWQVTSVPPSPCRAQRDARNMTRRYLDVDAGGQPVGLQLSRRWPAGERSGWLKIFGLVGWSTSRLGWLGWLVWLVWLVWFCRLSYQTDDVYGIDDNLLVWFCWLSLVSWSLTYQTDDDVQ